MKRFFALLLMAALFCFSHQHAKASADESCEGRWNLLTTQPYCVNWAFLNPGNDTRLNLQMLRADRGLGTLPAAISTTNPPEWRRSPPVPGKRQSEAFSSDEFMMAMAPADEAESSKVDAASFEKFVKDLGISDVSVGSGIAFEKGEGSRCLSNSAKSAGAFLEQVAAAPLAAAEKTALAQTRLTMLERCKFDASDIAKFGSIPGGSPFARYLQAAAQFYAGDFDDAGRSFQGLTTAEHPWLKETALYMVARTAINKAQANIAKEYGLIDLEAVDKTAAAEAGSGLEAYLKAYPQGIYANSAKGLRRKVA